MTLAEDNGPERGGDDLFAAEYVLGVLPVEERQIASRRIDTEADFARLVDGWEVHFSPLAVAYAEIEPPPSVKPAIDRRLFSSTKLSTSVQSWIGALGISVGSKFYTGTFTARLKRFTVSLWT